MVLVVCCGKHEGRWLGRWCRSVGSTMGQCCARACSRNWGARGAATRRGQRRARRQHVAPDAGDSRIPRDPRRARRRSRVRVETGRVRVDAATVRVPVRGRAPRTAATVRLPDGSTDAGEWNARGLERVRRVASRGGRRRHAVCFSARGRATATATATATWSGRRWSRRRSRCLFVGRGGARVRCCFFSFCPLFFPWCCCSGLTCSPFAPLRRLRRRPRVPCTWMQLLLCVSPGLKNARTACSCKQIEK